MSAEIRILARRMAELAKDAEHLAAAPGTPLRGIRYDRLTETLGRLRRERDVSLRQISDESGVDFRALHRLENGRDVTVKQIALLAKYLNEPIVFFPWDSPPPMPKKEKARPEPSLGNGQAPAPIALPTRE